DEFRKKREERRMIEMDKRHTEKVIEVQEENLKKMEIKIGKNIYEDINNAKSDEKILNASKEVYKLLREMVKQRNVIVSEIKTADDQKSRIKQILSNPVFTNISRNYIEFKSVMEKLKKLNNYINKKTANKYTSRDLIEDFIFEMKELANDNHIITVIKSSRKVVEVYNNLVDIYSHYESQIEEKKKSQNNIVNIEEQFQRKIEEITNRPGVIILVEKSPRLTSNYNIMVDLYNNYGKRKELLNELKEKEIRRRHSG
ncbi:MAG: hypothetical protein PHV16_04940, partial [Candidatus Nanoarchaeia archaeon]|nr:hypothetical protein [Candidatus Nanoarchaeia archaeon]